MSSIQLITAAAVFAAEAHSSQFRKILNVPYIEHPLRVGKMAAMLELPAEEIAACYLHDVVEDTQIPMQTIRDLFPERTAVLVQALTKWWESGHPAEVAAANKDVYYQHIQRVPGAALLKLLDRIDNLRDFEVMARKSPAGNKWAKRYHTKTVEEFSRYVLPCIPEVHSARKWYENALTLLETAL